MTPPEQNRLIEHLPRADRARLLTRCQPVQLQLADVLAEPGRPIRQLWFPVDAFISLVARTSDHPGLEVAMLGREGMLGASLALGVAQAPLHAVVQGAGSALCIAAAPFRRELARSAALRHLLGRYLYVQSQQLATTAACLRHHAIGQRMARWLLMSQDRAHADRFHVTHEFLAYMLGVRRVGVTVAAGLLQSSGVIRYHRGELTVLDRGRLRAAACTCYDRDLRAYADQLG